MSEPNVQAPAPAAAEQQEPERPAAPVQPPDQAAPAPQAAAPVQPPDQAAPDPRAAAPAQPPDQAVPDPRAAAPAQPPHQPAPDPRPAAAPATIELHDAGEGEADLELGLPAGRPRIQVTSSWWMGSDWSEEEKAKVRAARNQIVLGVAAPVSYAMAVWAASEKLQSDKNKSSDDDQLSSDSGGLSQAVSGLIVATGGGLYAVVNGILAWRGLITDHAKKVDAKNDPDLADLGEMMDKLKNLQDRMQREKDKLPKGDDLV